MFSNVLLLGAVLEGLGPVLGSLGVGIVFEIFGQSGWMFLFYVTKFHVFLACMFEVDKCGLLQRYFFSFLLPEVKLC